MNFELNPQQIKLDYERRILSSLQEDTFYTLLDIQENIARFGCARIIDAAAQLLISDECSKENLLKSNAFCSGGAVALMSLIESNAEPEVQEKIFKQLQLRSVPVSLIGENEEATLNSFTILAQEGLRAHSELRDVTDYVEDFYSKKLRDRTLGKVAFCGVGFMLYQIDKAGERMQDIAVEIEWQEQLKTFDVNKLLD